MGCLFVWGHRLGGRVQKPLQARPCALVSGHPWPPTFLDTPSQTVQRNHELTHLKSMLR